MLLMMNKLSHHVNDHIYLQNNIKVAVSECHVRIQEKATGHFLIRKYTFAGYKMMACVLKMLTQCGIFNRKTITMKPATKGTNNNKDTLLYSKRCIYENANIVF